MIEGRRTYTSTPDNWVADMLKLVTGRTWRTIRGSSVVRMYAIIPGTILLLFSTFIQLSHCKINRFVFI